MMGSVLDVRASTWSEWRPFTSRTTPGPPWLVHPVLALGNFDGLHRGHLKIIERVKRGAAEHGGTPMAMTFDPHPPRVVRPDKAPPLLMTKAQRLEALHQRRHHVRGGRALHARAVAVGSRRRSCGPCSSTGCASRRSGSARTFCSATIAAATSACCARSASATAFAPTRSIRCATRTSSSAARASAGWWPKGAWTRRGRCSATRTTSTGSIVEGRRRGREIGFPTANLTTDNELLPPHGVYATTMTIDGIVHAGPDQHRHAADVRRDRHRPIETHLLGYSGDLYGRAVRLAFVLRLRDERRFEDVDALRAQIEADQRRAERLFSRLSV